MHQLTQHSPAHAGHLDQQVAQVLSASQQAQLAAVAASALLDRLHAALRELRQSWPALLDPSRQAGAGGTSVAGSRIPLLTEALHLRVQVQTVLAGWTAWAAGTLPLCPTHAHLLAATPTRDVPALAGWLIEHAHRLLDDPTTTTAADELAELASQVRRITHPDGVRTISVPAVVRVLTEQPAGDQEEHDGDTVVTLAQAASARGAACPYAHCPGTLAMLAVPGRPAAITCSADDYHAWEQHQWVLLARRLGDDAPRRMASGELAEWLSAHLHARIPRRTLLSWATRYPGQVVRGADGLFDRVEVATWYVAHRARTT